MGKLKSDTKFTGIREPSINDMDGKYYHPIQIVFYTSNLLICIRLLWNSVKNGHITDKKKDTTL